MIEAPLRHPLRGERGVQVARELGVDPLGQRMAGQPHPSATAAHRLGSRIADQVAGQPPIIQRDDPPRAQPAPDYLDGCACRGKFLEARRQQRARGPIPPVTLGQEESGLVEAAVGEGGKIETHGGYLASNP
jgi:hypothetical protein